MTGTGNATGQHGRVGRRGFLTLAAVAGAAACAPALARPAAAATTGVDLAALKKALKGPLLRPGDAGYATAAQPFNAALGVRRPAAIAKAANRADVSTCVRRVAGHGVPLAARSGGHSYAGFSTPDKGVVVDLSALRGIKVRDDGTAVVGAGARLMDVYAALAAHGRALPAGSCPTVGIAGSTLGGGIGVVARAYGLTCDHLKSATARSSPISRSAPSRRRPSRSSRCGSRPRVRPGSCAPGRRGWTRPRTGSRHCAR
jgi:hypothetical protein